MEDVDDIEEEGEGEEEEGFETGKDKSLLPSALPRF